MGHRGSLLLIFSLNFIQNESVIILYFVLWFITSKQIFCYRYSFHLDILLVYKDGLLCPWDSPGRNLEWVAIPFSRDLPDPGIETVSPELQADSLPSEPLWGEKKCISFFFCLPSFSSKGLINHIDKRQINKRKANRNLFKCAWRLLLLCNTQSWLTQRGF